MTSLKTIIGINLVALCIAAGFLTDIHLKLWQLVSQYHFDIPVMVGLSFFAGHLIIRFILAVSEYVAYQRLQ